MGPIGITSTVILFIILIFYLLDKFGIFSLKFVPIDEFNNDIEKEISTKDVMDIHLFSILGYAFAFYRRIDDSEESKMLLECICEEVKDAGHFDRYTISDTDIVFFDKKGTGYGVSLECDQD